MDATRFDALTRLLAATGPRRLVVAAAAAGLISQDAAAGCKKVGKKCDKSKDCCDGAKCKGGKKGKCRCKSGWSECGQDGACQNLASDAGNCGACGQSCASATGDCGPCNPSCAAPCCVDGACHASCGGDCCADCFVEADGEDGQPHCGTELCCPASLLCTRGTGDPGDDLCCWPNEVCIDGDCCRDGGRGTVVCGGTCCSSGSCCNGTCCAGDQVCARVKQNQPRKCVSANRSCATDSDCFEGEACWGGTCCFADRRCFTQGPNAQPVCCAVGMYCDVGNNLCCANGEVCSTSKKVRIHA